MKYRIIRKGGTYEAQWLEGETWRYLAGSISHSLEETDKHLADVIERGGATAVEVVKEVTV